MPISSKNFRNNSKNIFSTTAIALIFSAMPNYLKAAEELDNDSFYGPVSDLTSFIESDEATTNVTFRASEGSFFSIGANSVISLTNQSDSGVLNVGITNDGGSLTASGIIFEDDIVTRSDNVINLNVNDGNVIFRGNISDPNTSTVNITAGNSSSATTSELTFTNFNNESLTIWANIRKENAISGNVLNINIANDSDNEENFISFKENLGYGFNGGDNSAINDLTIGDDGDAKTNNIIFEGQYLSARNINIGVEGFLAQTHNITLQGSLREIIGDVNGVAQDQINITKNNSLDTVVYGAVSNIDNFTLDGGSFLFRGCC
jgi:hypothetical protein